MSIATRLTAGVLAGVVLGAFMVLVPTSARAAGVAALELEVVSGGRPVKLNQPGALVDERGRALSLTRLDVLLSEFSLQRADGTWTRSKDWHGFFRAGLPIRREPLPMVPPGDYVAVRFAVGVGRAHNHADPHRLGPKDPLHPVVNGLHWGWSGGYVFMALEGHWQFDQAPTGSTGGFSYHLAGNENLVRLSQPARLHVRPGSVLQLRLDAQRLLAQVNVVRDGDSTHSRGPDPIVRKIKSSLGPAFSISVGTPAETLAARAAISVASRHAAPPGKPMLLTVGAHMPSVSLPDDNPLTVAGVALGKLLFADKRLSRDGSVSCATCHQADQAFADVGKARSTGVGGRQGVRNAMPLFNLAWVQEFFWDGRVRGLRHQVLHPIQDAHEMGETLPRVLAKLAADKHVAERFAQAFGGLVTAERIGLALEQYLLTLVSQDSKFDRVMKGASRFTPAESRGFELFLTEHDPANGLRGADCFHCHGGSLFTNHQFMNNGLPILAGDVGRERVSGNEADRAKFRTPSLRNLTLTAPYMHDGRFKTLEEVVEHYDHGVQRSASLDPNLAKHPPKGLTLSAADKAALVAFLRTLTDQALTAAAAR